MTKSELPTLKLKVLKNRTPSKSSMPIAMGDFKGSRAIHSATNCTIQMQRTPLVKKLPWWKKVWYRIFGFPTPRYEDQSYD